MLIKSDSLADRSNMKYKTVIEITSEAENQAEAMDIAGEYLRGSLDSGVHMKCSTSPLYDNRKTYPLLWIMSLSTILIIIVNALAQKELYKGKPDISMRDYSAIQPALKTQYTDFAKEWAARQDSGPRNK
jgi:hypothetical protein